MRCVLNLLVTAQCCLLTYPCYNSGVNRIKLPRCRSRLPSAQAPGALLRHAAWPTHDETGPGATARAALCQRVGGTWFACFRRAPYPEDLRSGWFRPRRIAVCSVLSADCGRSEVSGMRMVQCEGF